MLDGRAWRYIDTVGLKLEKKNQLGFIGTGESHPVTLMFTGVNAERGLPESSVGRVQACHARVLGLGA